MKKYISIIIITLIAAGSSCKKDYLNLVDNPNQPSSASPGLLLAGALKTSAATQNGGGYVMYAAWVGYLAQSTGFQPFVALEQYQFTTSTYDVWTTPYLNLSNYAALEASAPGANYTAIAEIMQCFVYQGLVDNYNNVPYTTALKGTANLNPTYTAGSAIYADLFKRLDAAIKLIQGAGAGAANPTKSDIVFGGNMTNWIKFANTIKLRMALRLSNTSGGTAAGIAEVATTSSLGFLDAATPALANPGYASSDANGGQQSPLWLYYGTSASGQAEGGNAQYQANSYLADYLGTNKDPRLITIFTGSATAGAATATALLPGSSVDTYPNAAGNLVAVVSSTFGDSQPPTGTINGTSTGITPSKVGSGVLKSASMPAVLISSAESLFLQAEAQIQGYNLPGGTAQSFYNAGVAASFVDQGAQANTVGSTTPLSPAASAAAMTAPGGVYAFPAPGAGGDISAQQTAIITQKWIALAITGSLEAFNEERRTGIPNVPTSIYPGANAPNQVTRIFYPIIEYSTNAASVAAQGTIDKFTSKIFWAK